MKKYIGIIILLILPILISSCSSGQKTEAPKTAAPSQEIGSIDPLLTKSKYIRQQLTDPALFDYLEKHDANILSNDVAQTDKLSQKKIGIVSNFTAASKYAIKGTVTVLSTTSLKVTSFSYNGGCGPLQVAVTLSNNSTKKLATLKEVSQPVSNSVLSLELPGNIALSQFDVLGLYCPNSEDPVSTAELIAS